MMPFAADIILEPRLTHHVLRCASWTLAYLSLVTLVAYLGGESARLEPIRVKTCHDCAKLLRPTLDNELGTDPTGINTGVNRFGTLKGIVVCLLLL